MYNSDKFQMLHIVTYGYIWKIIEFALILKKFIGDSLSCLILLIII